MRKIKDALKCFHDEPSEHQFLFINIILHCFLPIIYGNREVAARALDRPTDWER